MAKSEKPVKPRQLTERELRIIGLLGRSRTILGNMAKEREGFWQIVFRGRWPISHEPLRSDARNLLPLIDAEIAAIDNA